ncbi:alpha/beta hydrolase [Fictibacillus sp. b24]|uniref:alpha/beta fold hydrolase n=1 Tax=Fictibacillus sp. b24 TaxID=3055863 RepID=UPI0025A0CB1D|nr:alpha/beta hydrolase [Fictibacillus sp. b24]MDM5316994.1 alpha/beta hydrolase [Fictibacillus sp. b24]
MFKAEKHVLTSQDGTKITAYDHGGSGETIVFVHYLGGIAQAWEPVIKYFTDKYRVLTYDLRGHGQSGQPDNGYTFEDTANDLESVINHFRLDKVHLVGSSYGCMVGLYYAAMRRVRVLSLVNIDGAMINDTGEGGLYEESLEEHLAKFEGQFDPDYESVDAFKQYYRNNWEPWNEARANYVNHFEPRVKENGTVGGITTEKTIKNIISEIYYVDFLTWYEKTECPVLFLPAEKENHLEKSMRFIEKASKGLPYSKTVLIPNTTHLMMYDHGKELAEAVQKFYAELPISQKSSR